MFYEGADRAVEVAAAANPIPNGVKPILPLANVLPRRQPMFDEYQLAVGFEHAAHFLERSDRVGYGTQGPGGHDSIDAAAIDRDGWEAPLDYLFRAVRFRFALTTMGWKYSGTMIRVFGEAAFTSARKDCNLSMADCCDVL